MGKYKGVKTLEVLEGADNYNKWIASTLQDFIKSPALEVGAGTGNISEQLLHLDKLILTDSDAALVDVLRKKFVENKNVSCELLDITADFSKAKNYFNTIFAINVLEHIKDDEKALRNMKHLLSKNGKIVLLVPAKKFAFTNLDKSLGHFRRYEKSELEEKLLNTGYEIEEIFFFNIVGLVSWLVRDRVSRDDTHLKKSQVRIFDAVVPFLKKLEPKKSLPLGISLIAVAKKK